MTSASTFSCSSSQSAAFHEMVARFVFRAPQSTHGQHTAAADPPAGHGGDANVHPSCLEPHDAASDFAQMTR